jgi:hemoglobin
VKKLFVAATAALLCVSGVATAIDLSFKDGETPLPDYAKWPVFLSGVQREDAGQVRDLYINPIGAAAEPGQPFPVGTIMVMENHKATKGRDGTLAKVSLGKIFLMKKVEGPMSSDITPGLENGTWVYSAFSAAGKPLTEDFNACRGCHLPDAGKDFVKRYDEYFQRRLRG